MLSFKALLTAGMLSALMVSSAHARTILFLGSSFTYGAHSAAQHYHPELVKDLNGPASSARPMPGFRRSSSSSPWKPVSPTMM